ncbi:MAG: putative aminohydrolase SsnA [Candidatus Cloacimonadota bacterium]|nr:MAG: putative aminohydrolase SsnA [Candidatus Cloacimonadota bacterium]
MIIKNCRIWTNDNQYIINGYVKIDDDKISKVGAVSDLSRIEYNKAIDGKNYLLMPGLVNCHTHLYSSLARGMNFPNINPKNFRQILEQIWWKLDRVLDEQSIYYSALVGGIENIRNGVTTIIDHHASPNHISGSLNLIKKAIVDEIGIRANLCYEITERNRGIDELNECLQENLSFLDSLSKNDDMATGLIGLHAPFTISDNGLRKISKPLKDYKYRIHTHLSESNDDQNDAQNKGYKNVVHRLQKFDLLKENSIIAHGIHLSDEEYKILESSNIFLISNIESNMNNGVGVLNIPELLKTHLIIGAGNDGFGFNLLNEMRMTSLVFKDKQLNSQEMPFSSVHKIFFENNYKIIERLFNIKIGKIKHGYKADLILVDYKSPTEINSGNFMAHLVFGMMDKFDVKSVIINGKCVMKEEKFLSLNLDSVYKESRKVFEDLQNRLIFV